MLKKLLEAASGEDAAAAVASQRGLLELLIALAPALDEASVQLLWRAVRPHLQHPEALLQKKAYKTLQALASRHAPFVSANLSELREALEAALACCQPACKAKRLGCLQSLLSQLPQDRLLELLPSLLGEVVLATKEPNVKTRAAAFDLLLALAEHLEKRAGPAAADGAAALERLLTMAAAGLAGKTPHMIAATLLALSRLVYEYRASASLVPFATKLLRACLTLLSHRAQEVIRAVIVYIKVALSTLPPEHIEPLLPQLVPPMLHWCSNKYAHLKYAVRYLMERLVKRFGHEAMMAVTPLEHQRLLTHMRKTKERERRHTLNRLAQKGDAAEGAGGSGGRRRHATYEDLIGEGEGADGEWEAAAPRGGGGGGGGVGLRETWTDRSESAADVDLLSAPLLLPPAPVGARRGKRARDEQPLEEEEAAVRFDDAGKLLVDAAAAAPTGSAVQMDVEVDAEDEVVRSGKFGKRQRRDAALNRVNEASAAEVADARRENAKPNRMTLSKKNKGVSDDHFGAQLGEQYRSKSGAKGDVLRAGAPQPFAYLPLNPRMLGKRSKRQADLTAQKLMGNPNKVRGHKSGKYGLKGGDAVTTAARNGARNGKRR